MSNIVPEGWYSDKLSNICNIVGGGTPDRSNSLYWNGDIPWVSPTDITKLQSKYISKSKEKITALGLAKSSAKLHPIGTVLMTSRASIGYVAINTVPVSTNQGFQSLQCKSNIYNEYLYQHITWIRRDLEKLSAGSTFSEISSTNLKSLTLIIPPLSEQKKIAAILTSVDEVIEKTQAQIDKLKDLKTAMMQELLTKGVGVDGKPHTEFKDSPVGRIPKGWECVQLGLLLQNGKSAMRSGPFGSALLKHELVPEGHPYLGIDNVHIEHFENKFKRFVSNDKFEQLIKYAVKPDDVMITIMGTVGRSCVVPQSIGKALSSKHVWTMSFDQAKYIPSLICWQLNYSNWVKLQFQNESQGGVMASISSKTLRELWLPVPPIAEQNKIYKVHKSLSESIEVKQGLLHKYQNIKKALMQDLLTGKVRVKVD